MCIFSVIIAPFAQSFDAAELKIELAKGNYESPYIVRPLEDITVNGVSIDEYRIVASDDALCTNAVQTLVHGIHKACGKRMTVSKKNIGQSIFHQ